VAFFYYSNKKKHHILIDNKILFTFLLKNNDKFELNQLNTKKAFDNVSETLR